MTSPQALPISTLTAMTREYENFKLAYSTAATALQNVISTGTVLYTDANFLAEFPNTWATYQAYLQSLQNSINTFIAGLPVEPPLNG